MPLFLVLYFMILTESEIRTYTRLFPISLQASDSRPIYDQTLSANCFIRRNMRLLRLFYIEFHPPCYNLLHLIVLPSLVKSALVDLYKDRKMCPFLAH